MWLKWWLLKQPWLILSVNLYLFNYVIFTVRLFIGSFKITSYFKERTSNTLSASYSLDSCPLAKLLLFKSIDEDNRKHNRIEFNNIHGYLGLKQSRMHAVEPLITFHCLYSPNPYFYCKHWSRFGSDIAPQ